MIPLEKGNEDQKITLPCLSELPVPVRMFVVILKLFDSAAFRAAQGSTPETGQDYPSTVAVSNDL
jgi:hypothetical protein